MIPYGRQDISQADIDAVVNVLISDFLTQGPTVPAFEKAVTSFCGAEHGIAVSNATAGLHIACMALDVGPGDTVWTSPNTFVASSNSALYCGAKVDFVDIDPQTYNISIARLTEKLAYAARDGRLPKVLIPVHHCGQSCDMKAIRRLADEYGFRIIEDAAHAIGAFYDGAPVGTCTYSDITVFSFHPVKIITTGEGGLAVTNDSALAEKMRRFRSHGITSDRSVMEARPENEIWNYQQMALGFNYRMTDIHAALGLSQMSRLTEFVDARRRIAVRYDAALADLPITLPWQMPESNSSYHLYPVLVDQDRCGVSQKQFYSALWGGGVAVNLHYIPVYLQPYYEKLGFKRGYCPVAERYFQQAISLPIFPGLADSQQDCVVQQIRDALQAA
ncbi:UDP-4-amino-4,6-dideoxy-N-acetyl-beta-L-altrosamine transaminase [Shinella sumterensis]|uniref:UDP-4-amino-4, 6-dideoxy-N-acetyl-beta-L-altrosamine transaminase n=1 Tax=Shinella sumterensis TaxID=1967501 RepID=A0AA50CKK1_9HYPH|nr:UDP-4-amino-4,6-dideoxy-N-acetyl-beta-L-altrosamine transaminase [Shinella sumterensis]WLR96189.1 UDP-4-amino-4,6-dideoxy-N-acetyl-beta-L-altrosamine transaminase [Shinella sumterensis]